MPNILPKVERKKLILQLNDCMKFHTLIKEKLVVTNNLDILVFFSIYLIHFLVDTSLFNMEFLVSRVKKKFF